MALTIYDISKKAGVSIATVSRVLNGSDNVRPSTRQKVLEIIQQYDYIPNALARGMGLHSTHTIGILCADCSNLFFAKAIYHLEQELHENGYESLLCCTGYNLDVRKNYLNLILSQRIDALILVGSNFIGTTEEENQYIKDSAAKVPIMLLNAAFTYSNVYSITCDDFSTMFHAASTMLNAGISDILYLYNSHSYSAQKKLDGFKAAMEVNHIKNYEHLIYFCDTEPQDIDMAADFVQVIADSGKIFHGVIASDDILGVGAVKYAHRNHICIPQDLAIIGYNNSILTSCCCPELTSIDNKLQTQTHQLVQTLLGVLSGKEMPQKSIFSGQLVERGTTNFSN